MAKFFDEDGNYVVTSKDRVIVSVGDPADSIEFTYREVALDLGHGVLRITNAKNDEDVRAIYGGTFRVRFETDSTDDDDDDEGDI